MHECQILVLPCNDIQYCSLLGQTISYELIGHLVLMKCDYLPVTSPQWLIREVFFWWHHIRYRQILYVYTHIFNYIYILCLYVYMYTYILCVYIHILYLYVYIFIYYVFTFYIYICVCCVCVYMCMHLYLFVHLYKYIYIYIYHNSAKIYASLWIFKKKPLGEA